VSCLVFIPRDRYTTQVRERIASRLIHAGYDADGVEWNTRLFRIGNWARIALRCCPPRASDGKPRCRRRRARAVGSRPATRARGSTTPSRRPRWFAAHGEEVGLDPLPADSGPTPSRPAYQDELRRSRKRSRDNRPRLQQRNDTTKPLAGAPDHRRGSSRPQALRAIGPAPTVRCRKCCPRPDEPRLSWSDDEHPLPATTWAAERGGPRTRWMRKWFRLQHGPRVRSVRIPARACVCSKKAFPRRGRRSPSRDDAFQRPLVA